MRRRRWFDLVVAAVATLVVAAVVKGAVGVSPSSSARTPTTADRTPAGGPATTRSPGAATAASTAAVVTRGSVVGPPTVLFVGEIDALRPRGGVRRSFACRAASTLGWQCQVLARVPRTEAADRSPAATPGETLGAGPGQPRADYVVVTTAVDDSLPEIRGVLQALPASLDGATMVILGPITADGSTRITGLIDSERVLAAAHHATFIDPVAEQWVTAATRDRYLNREQLTSVGIPVAAGRLATDLGRLPTPAPGAVTTTGG